MKSEENEANPSEASVLSLAMVLETKLKAKRQGTDKVAIPKTIQKAFNDL